jgi:5-methylthioadenosine/S-adenosylhomocysteine deaminase
MGNESDITLVNGLILADPGSGAVKPHGKTVIRGDRLLEVNSAFDKAQTPADHIDCSHCVIMPGLINAHNHAAMSLLRGAADDMPLQTWLNQYIFPAESAFVSPEFVYLGTCLSAMEMALSGTTTFADAYFFMEKSAEASADVGLRSIVAQGILDFPTPDNPVPEQWPARINDFLGNFPDHPLLTPALFCHSPYLCAPETLKRAKRIAVDRGIRLFCHVSETAWEVAEISSRFGKSPVEHLAGLGIMDKDFIAVHCANLSDQDVDTLKNTGTRVVHCPESNMKLASGAAPVHILMEKGVTVCLGTDGPASNNNLDVFEEMRTASLLAKITTKNPEALPAAAAIRAVTCDAAEALGLSSKIGTLAPGKLADLIVIDLKKPHLSPVYDVISHLVYSAKGSDVRDVFVNGTAVVRNRLIQTIDQEYIYSQVKRMAERISKHVSATFHGADLL